MTEKSYPIVNTPLSDVQWRVLSLTEGSGVIDLGGGPYLLTNIDAATDTVDIALDAYEAKNYAIVGGFIHEIDHVKTLSIPPVTATTTYVVGIVYDPTKNADPAGPNLLTVWTDPADYSSGKDYVELYRITREPNQSLDLATVEEIRQRVAPVIVVNNFSELPTQGRLVVETIAVTRDKGEFYRLHFVSAGNFEWRKINEVTGTHLPTANTIAKRDGSGGLQAYVTSTAGSAVVNRTYIDDALGGAGWVAATPYPTGHSIARRFDSGVIRVGDAVGLDDAVNNRVLNGRLGSSSAIDAAKISKTLGVVPWEAVSGSIHAYNETSGGSTYATVYVSNGGKFFRYTSAKKYKTDITPVTFTEDDVFSLEPIEYTDIESGERRIGFLADNYVDTFPWLVTKTEEGEVEGWHYELTTVVQQVAIRSLKDEVEQLKTEVQELKKKDAEKDQLIAELTRRLDALDGGSQASEG